MPEILFDTFLLLFVVIDPIGLAPMFIGLTPGESVADRRRLAVRATVLAGIVLVTFAVVGDALLATLHIGLPAFRIAGGLLLFLVAVDMVFARPSGARGPTPREQVEAEHKRDISVFPLAVPLIAGPGAITTILLATSRGGDATAALGAVLAMLAVVLLLTLAALLAASRLTRLLGETGTNVVGRVLGIVLAALAVQFVLDGVRAGLSLP
jgi:multiple antibiotic resistance protein